jgi:hypothetical protein
MLAVKGKRTIENTLKPSDEALIYLDAAGNQSGLIREVLERFAIECMGFDKIVGAGTSPAPTVMLYLTFKRKPL